MSIRKITVDQYKIDRLSEYYRVCAYCCTEFMAHHLHVKFCPTRFNSPGYCKGRYKRLNDEAKLVLGNKVAAMLAAANIAEPILVSNVTPVEIQSAPVVESSSIIPATNTEALEAQPTQMEINVRFGEEMLQGKEYRDFTFREIYDSPLDLKTYDERIYIPKADRHYIEFGDYALMWNINETFTLTYIKHII